MGLVDEIKRELSKNPSVSGLKSQLVRRGFLEKDIEEAFKKIVQSDGEEQSKNNKILSMKELFDRVGYGFASQQFINILFMLSGASLFLIGVMNAITASLNYFLTGFLRAYSRVKYIGKGFISTAGIVFGFSFLGMAFGVVIQSPLLFALSMLIGSLGIIAHGDVYLDFFNRIIRTEKRTHFLRFISYFGILITATSLLLAGFIMQFFPLSGTLVSFNPAALQLASPIEFKIYGYLLAFEMTAIMFILSGYMLSFIDEKKESLGGSHDVSFFNEYLRQSFENTRIFAKNPKVVLLTIAAIVTTVVQLVGNMYYGIFIYESFKNMFLGGFLNVALIFMIAVITSISGSMLTKKFSKSLGEAPMLVFGTLLIALLPATFYYNPNLYAIGLAVAISVIGGAIVGVAQGMIAERIMNEQEIKTFFSSLGFVSILPTLILVPIAAYLAQLYDLSFLFLLLAGTLVAIVVPVYFILVFIIDAEYRKEHRAK